MRIFGFLVLILLPTMGASQSLKSTGGYDVQWRVMQKCLEDSKDVAAEKICTDKSLSYCKLAGNFEGCLDSLVKWVGKDLALMQRSLGLKPNVETNPKAICDAQDGFPDAMCPAQVATALLLDLRAEMRSENLDPDTIETPIFHPQPILDCIEAASGTAVSLHCVGEGALACWHSENGGGPSDTIMQCLSAELRYWNDRLEPLKPEMQMQSDWETSRASRCAMVANATTSGADVMHMDCMLQLTGQYVLWLEAYR